MFERSWLVSGFAAVLLVAAPTAWGAEGEEEESNKPGPWGYTAAAGLNLSQSAFSNNWAGGDQGSITWVLSNDVTAKRQVSHKFNSSNLLQLAYGQTIQQIADPDNPSNNVWDTPSKNTDLILFESVGRFTLGAFVDPYVSFRMDSQFVDESDPIGNLLFNPVKFTESAGIAKVLQKSEDSEVISRLGFGFRQSFARTFKDALGEETESFSTHDGGLEWQTEATRPIMDKKVLYRGKLLVFLPVFYSLSDELEDFDAANPGREPVADFWKKPDVNFQNTFTAQLTELISVSLYLQWIYDKFDSATNVDPALGADALRAEVDSGIRRSGQFKETLALGFTYKFF